MIFVLALLVASAAGFSAGQEPVAENMHPLQGCPPRSAYSGRLICGWYHRVWSIFGCRSDGALSSILSNRCALPVTTVAPQSCGVKGSSSPSGKIVGGQETDPYEYPWQMLLSIEEDGQTYTCGGSLLSSTYVVTAAHCVESYTGLPVTVTIEMKQHDRTTPVLPAFTVFASEIIIHENYDTVTVDNDIALLKLHEPVSFDDKLSPVCLPPASNAPNYRGATSTVTGWGVLSEVGNSLTDKLQEVEVEVLSNKVCKDKYLGVLTISDNMLCAGDTKNGGEDACYGDSGGPLVVEDDDGNYVLVGIVSNGQGCARAKYPGVYTRVGNYVNWLNANMI
jgi:secreted trypsin-like serine protease